MTAIKFVPISLDVAHELLLFFREADLDEDDLDDAHALTRRIGEAIAIAGEHVDVNAMLVAELLELIGRVTGRPLSTIPGPRSLAEATAALEDMAPVLGGTVLRLPPRPERETEQAIEAATARALADMPGPISMRVFVECRESFDGQTEHEPVDVWAVPREREEWGGFRVKRVAWDSPNRACLFLAANPPEDVTF
jgi:hypothetical protein